MLFSQELPENQPQVLTPQHPPISPRLADQEYLLSTYQTEDKYGRGRGTASGVRVTSIKSNPTPSPAYCVTLAGLSAFLCFRFLIPLYNKKAYLIPELD